jgi:hypothetical protein
VFDGNFSILRRMKKVASATVCDVANARLMQQGRHETLGHVIALS